MFKMRFSQYISDNMVRHNLSYKDIAARSGVPPTTLSYYARGQVNTPNDEYCVKIAAVFGDGPEVIDTMRRAALASTAEENKAIARSSDPESAEKLAALMRSNMLTVLEEFKANAESEYERRLNNVRGQYEGHIVEVEKHCQDKLADQERYFERLLDIERQTAARLHEHNERSKAYLKIIITNLSITLGIVGTLAIAFGMYAVFAYRTFDMNDLTQGLAQHEHTAAPFVMLLVIICIGVFFGGKFVFAKKMRKRMEG